MNVFIANRLRSAWNKTCVACLVGLLSLPAGAAFAQSPGDLLDEGLNRLNRAFEELTQSGEGGGTPSAPSATPAPRSGGPIALTVDATTRIWCPNDQTMALIGAFAPLEAEMSNRGVLTVEGEGGVRLDLQPGAGCALIVE